MPVPDTMSNQGWGGGGPQTQLAMLMAGATGGMPSAAGILGRSMLEQQQHQMMGMAAGAQGVPAGLAFRTAMQGAQDAGLQANAQFSAQAAQEQQNYMQMLSDWLQGQEQAALQRKQIANQPGFGKQLAAQAIPPPAALI